MLPLFRLERQISGTHSLHMAEAIELLQHAERCPVAIYGDSRV